MQQEFNSVKQTFQEVGYPQDKNPCCIFNIRSVCVL